LNAIKNGTLYPVCFADSVENIGSDLVLDYIVKYLPSPADLNIRRPIESETYPENQIRTLHLRVLFSKLMLKNIWVI